MSAPPRIVICGGGAIGAAIAYFTSRRGAPTTVIERHAVAGAASGKSGGFLALDWCRGSSLDRLARRSFELHAELSAELGDPWGYRRLTTYGGYAVEGDTACAAPGRPWLAGGVAITSRLGSPETTALVEPGAFTTGLMHAAEAHGALLRRGTVVELVRRPSGAARGVALASGEILSPEVFPRVDGTTWVCAISTLELVPVDPADVAPDQGAHARIEALCRNISPALAAAPIKARQACFRPVTADGLPLMGSVSGVDGAYVATGHSVWGMLNAPATGEAMSELILDGAARRVDLAPFAPGRLPPLGPAHLRGASG